jgi:integrase
VTTYEFRYRSANTPTSLFPQGEVRIYLGQSSNKREAQALEHQRETLKKLARRAQWDILAGIRAGTLTVEQVVRLADEKGLDVLHVELRDPGAGDPVGGMVETFLETVERDTTRAIYRNELKRLVAHVGADTPWDKAGRHQINDVLDQMRREGRAANTRASARTAISAFFSWAIDREDSLAEKEGRKPRITKNPARGSQRVNKALTRKRFLLPEELDELIRVAPPALRAQYLTLAYTGMRFSEFASRTREDVDPATVIRIVARDDWAPKGWPRYRHGERDIPVHQKRLRPALEDYLRDFAGERYVFVNPRTGERWRHTAFRVQLMADLAAARLEHGRDNPNGITAHSFRHTLGSWLAQRDVQLLKIAQILGDTVQSIVIYYAHLLPGDLDHTINSALD